MKIPKNLKRSTSKYQCIRIIRYLQKLIKENCYRCMNIPPTSRILDCKLESCSLYSVRPWRKEK